MLRNQLSWARQFQFNSVDIKQGTSLFETTQRSKKTAEAKLTCMTFDAAIITEKDFHEI